LEKTLNIYGQGKLYTVVIMIKKEGDAVKMRNPESEVVFIVDKNAEKGVAQKVKETKKTGIIDPFIYSLISATYLADIVDSL